MTGYTPSAELKAGDKVRLTGLDWGVTFDPNHVHDVVITDDGLPAIIADAGFGDHDAEFYIMDPTHNRNSDFSVTRVS